MHTKTKVRTVKFTFQLRFFQRWSKLTHLAQLSVAELYSNPQLLSPALPLPHFPSEQTHQSPRLAASGSPADSTVEGQGSCVWNKAPEMLLKLLQEWEQVVTLKMRDVLLSQQMLQPFCALAARPLFVEGTFKHFSLCLNLYL